MNAILGLTALSLDDPGLSPDVKNNLVNIRNSGEFLLGLVNDVLDMSKIEHGDIQLHYEPYSYSDFLTNIKSMFVPLCEQNGLKFEFEDVTTTLTVMTDKIRLNQIFFNIISNAVKYTLEGGTVKYYTENLVVKGNSVSAYYIVEDTGIGMSEEFQKHMFEPFQQESSEVTAHLQGTGLGLSISKSLVESMGGTMRIESKQNAGTKVIIHLTFEIAPSQKNKQPESIAEDVNSTLSGRHILLVEDHPLNAAIAGKLLEKVDVRVDFADNGKVGVDKFQYSPVGEYDAILMDVRMPIMDGIEATKAIRALGRPDAKTVPIIAMTANAYEEDVQNCLNAGMNAHLAKPVKPATMYKTISEHLMKH
jgi:CheY-like chemotaxis protein/two-component sensor histidine kinase